MFWYNLSSLTEEQRRNIIIADLLEGYDGNQIARMYRIKTEEVLRVRTTFIEDATKRLDIEKLRREDP